MNEIIIIAILQNGKVNLVCSEIVNKVKSICENDLLNLLNEAKILLNLYTKEIEVRPDETLEVFRIVKSKYIDSNYFKIELNNKLFSNINSVDKKNDLFSKEFYESCISIIICLNKTFAESENETLLNISVVNMLNCEAMVEVRTDLERELFTRHFLVEELLTDKKSIYYPQEFRPCVRNICIDFMDYINYLNNFIEDKKKIRSINDPIILTLTVYSNLQMSINFNKEYEKLILKYLSREELNFFYSDLDIIINDLLSELVYIKKNI